MAVTCATAEAVIYCTLDGTSPVTSSTKRAVAGPITVSTTTTLKAYAVKSGMIDSNVASAAYTIALPPVTMSWSRIEGIWGGAVNRIAVDPTNGNTAYLSTINGVFKTTDGGALWLESSDGIPAMLGPWDLVGDLAIAPTDPNLLFASVHASEVDVEKNGIYKSTDAGATWSLSMARLTGVISHSIAIDPSTADTAYAIADGLYKTVDQGASWSKIRTGTVNRLCIDPLHSDRLVIIENSTTGNWWEMPLTMTQDGGNTWSGITNNLYAVDSQGAPKQVLIDPTDSNIIYVASNGGVFKTTNGGVVWFQPGSTVRPRLTSSISMDPNDPQILYTAGESGIYRTANGGASWTNVNSSDHAYVVQTTVDPNKLYANLDIRSVVTSDDAGSTWQESQAGVIGYEVRDLCFHAGILLAAANDAGVFASNDGGASFEHLVPWVSGFSSTGNLGVLTDPADPDGIYVYGSGLVKSSNGGGSWATISPSPAVVTTVRSLLIDPDDPDILYAATSTQGIYKTLNDGNAWNAINEGLFVTDIHDLAMVPGSPGVLYAAANGGGVFKTINGGTQWAGESTGLTNWNVRRLAVDPGDAATIYAGTINGTGSLYKTTDGAGHWIPSNAGLPAGTEVYDISIDPDDSDRIYIATDNGIFESVDAAAGWAGVLCDYGDFLPLCLEKRSDGLYVGTRANGLVKGVK